MSKVIFRSQAKLDDPERWWYFESKWTVQNNRRVKVNGPRILKGNLDGSEVFKYTIKNNKVVGQKI